MTAGSGTFTRLKPGSQFLAPGLGSTSASSAATFQFVTPASTHWPFALDDAQHLYRYESASRCRTRVSRARLALSLAQARSGVEVAEQDHVADPLGLRECHRIRSVLGNRPGCQGEGTDLTDEERLDS